MKVLFVTQSLEKGGAERLALDMAHALSKQDKTIRVKVVPLSPLNEYKELSEGLDIEVCNSKVELSITGKSCIDITDYERIVDSFQPDIIHSHTYVAELVSREHIRPGIAYFTHVHNDFPEFDPLSFSTFLNKHRLARFYERFRIFGRYLQANNQFITISRSIDQHLKGQLPKKWFKNIHKILNGFPKILSKLYKDLRFRGVMNVRVENKSFLLHNPGFTTIENEIFWFGLENGWEKVSMKLWIELVKNSNTILDIGANTGVYSLVAATVNNHAKVYAFEPVKRTSDILKQNLELNPNLNIQLVEKAVSNSDSLAEFYDLPTDSQYSASLNADMLASFPNRISYEVETIRLDSYTELNNQKIDLIKLDVEMHEPEALEGMMDLIKKNEPTFLIEILNQTIAEKVEFLLKDLNYICFSLDEENEPKFLGRIMQSDFHNLLLIKKEKLDTVGLSIQEINE